MTNDQIEALIQRSLTDTVSSERIVLKGFRFDVDHDGDPVIRILISFDSHRDLAPDKGLALKRVIRAGLVGCGIDAYPIVTFISNDEFREIEPEAA